MLRSVTIRLAREERGFTLLELLLVTTILGILSAIALPAYLGFQDRASKAAASSDMAVVTRDVERYNVNNYPGAPTASDPNWNGTDAAGTGTNGDTGYADTWAGAGHDVISLINAKYDSSISTSYHFDPTGWAPATGLTASTDYCAYVVVGLYYGARHGPNGAITAGKYLHLGADGTCVANGSSS